MWTPTKTKKYGVGKVLVIFTHLNLINIYFLNYISAIYNWHGENPYGLHLEIGDTVQILEQCCG